MSNTILRQFFVRMFIGVSAALSCIDAHGMLVFPDIPSPTNTTESITYESLDLSSAKILEIDIRSPTDFDSITWNLMGDGKLELGGTLLIDWVDDGSGSDYVPAPGTSFQIFTFNELIGTFDDICFHPPLPGGMEATFDYTTGTLSAVPEPSAFLCIALVAALASGRRFLVSRFSAEFRKRPSHGV